MFVESGQIPEGQPTKTGTDRELLGNFNSLPWQGTHQASENSHVNHPSDPVQRLRVNVQWILRLNNGKHDPKTSYTRLLSLRLNFLIRKRLQTPHRVDGN